MLFILFTLSYSAKFMKWSFLRVGPGYSEEFAKEYYDDVKKNKESYCLEDGDEYGGYDACIAYHDALEESRYSKGSDINSVLKQFSKDNEFLIIVGSQMAEMDFNNLKAQMKVAFEYDDSMNEEYSVKKINPIRNIIRRMMKVSFDGSDDSIMELSKTKKQHRTNKVPKLNEDPILIVGNIKKKVSFLGIDEGYIKFTKADVDCHSLGLGTAVVADDSKKIRTTFLLLGVYSFDYISEILRNSDFVQVNQLTFKINSFEDIKYYITYTNDAWVLTYNDRRSGRSGNDDGYITPYKRASIFNLLSNGYQFVISRRDDTTLDSYPPINITSMKTYSYGEVWAKQLEKHSISITQENFDNIDENKRPKITLSYDTNLYQFDQEANKDFKITPEDKYSYKPPNRKNTNVGMIVGIVIACIVVVVVVIVVVIIVIRKKRQGGGQTPSDKEGEQ